jgi:hypothetical protein
MSISPGARSTRRSSKSCDPSDKGSLGSSRELNCAYSPRPGVTEYHAGNIQKLGVDIGYVSNAVMVWSVIAPTSDLAPSALAGTYVGATASASVGVGVGANVLVGGFEKSVTLQPVSIEGNQGLNVAGGIGAISLRFERAVAVGSPY